MENQSSGYKLDTLSLPQPIQRTLYRPPSSIRQSFPSRTSHITSKSSDTNVQSQPIKTKIGQFLNGIFYNIFISIITIYVLFADDVRQIFFPPSADLPFTVVLLICIGIFIAELVLSLVAKPEYFFNFFFWLDLVSVGTMVFDLMWINVGGAAGIAANIVQIARAGKATRIGARSARIIRIVKLMRNIQEYKKAKQIINSEQPKPLEEIVIENTTKNVNARRRQAIIEPISAESKINFHQNLKQEITRKVYQKQSSKEIKLRTYSELVDIKETMVSMKIKQAMEVTITMMIIFLLLSVPLLSSSTWFQQTPVYQSSIQQLDYFAKHGIDKHTIEFQMMVFINQSTSLYNPLVYLKFPINQTCCEYPRDFPELGVSLNTPELDDLRASSIHTQETQNIIVVYNLTGNDIFTSQLNAGRTMFVCVLLIFSSLFFNKDIEDYLLEPLDSMLNTVKRISSDPLKAMIAIENENTIKSSMEGNKEDDRKLNEPAILEDLVIKIGSLLVVGFGEAGSEIIVKNIETHGDINPVLSGTKMIAIFGFCDIRNFTDAMEVLQTGVLNFVNDVAEIVHGIIHKCGGTANKNIGDAFLLVWKFKSKEIFLSDKNGKTEVTLRRIKKVSQMTDLAVYSFMKIIAELTKSHQLKKYTNDEGLKNRIKDFTGVKMGFGLHVGWAIEGAIGSKFKIDASYLSPNVNMASRLQAATKQFGVLALYSGAIVQLMTPTNKKLMRRIDRVTVKGSIEPIDLYTLDMHVQNLNYKQQKQPPRMTNFEKKKLKMFVNKTREAMLSGIEEGKNITERLFLGDKDFEKMREIFTSVFYEEWNKGFEMYIRGCWKEARECFEYTRSIYEYIDGPSNTLIDVLEAQDNQCPRHWEGYRELTEK